MGSNPDDALVGEGSKAEGTGGVGNKVEESADGGDHEVGAVRGDTVGDGTHAVLADTVALCGGRGEGEGKGKGSRGQSGLRWRKRRI